MAKYNRTWLVVKGIPQHFFLNFHCPKTFLRSEGIAPIGDMNDNGI